MKKGKLLGIVCVVTIVAGLLLAGCASEAPPTEGPPTEGPPTEGPPTEEPPEVFHITMCTQHPYEDPMNKYINEGWFNYLERESDGRLTFTLYPSSQAAEPPLLYDAARDGIVDISCVPLSATPGRWVLNEVCGLPLLFDYPAARQVNMTESAMFDKYPELQAEMSDVKVLCWHSTGVQQLHIANRPVHTLEDVEGLQIACFGEYAMRATEALGGVPANVVVTELYDALAKGVVDAEWCNYVGLLIFNWAEHLNYCTETNLVADQMVHVMNLDTWNSLPADLQELIEETYWLLPEVYGYQFDTDDFVCKEIFEGMMIDRGHSETYVMPEAEQARWQEAIRPVWEEWISDAAAIVGEDKARAMLEDAQAFTKQYPYEETPFDLVEDTFRDWGVGEYLEGGAAGGG